jgi:hypothetical protein
VAVNRTSVYPGYFAKGNSDQNSQRRTGIRSTNQATETPVNVGRAQDSAVSVYQPIGQ